MWQTTCQWPFQDPLVPTKSPTGYTCFWQKRYKAYFLGLCKGISPENMARNMVQYLHQLDPEIPIEQKKSNLLGLWVLFGQPPQNPAINGVVVPKSWDKSMYQSALL